MATKKRSGPLTPFQREWRKQVDKAYKAAIAKEKKEQAALTKKLKNSGKNATIKSPTGWVKAKAIKIANGRIYIKK